MTDTSDQTYIICIKISLDNVLTMQLNLMSKFKKRLRINFKFTIIMITISIAELPAYSLVLFRNRKHKFAVCDYAQRLLKVPVLLIFK